MTTSTEDRKDAEELARRLNAFASSGGVMDDLCRSTMRQAASMLAAAPAQPVAMTDERVSLISRLKAQSVAHRHEAETDSADLIDEGVAALSAMTDLLEEARDTIAKLLIKIRRDAPDSAGRLLGYADQVVARVDAALDSPLSAQAAPKVLDEQRCEYCDGTGDVHSIDGQWRGECTACKPEAKAQAVPDGYSLVAVKGLDDLVYWLDRCEGKGHLENCSDLLEPWAAFDWIPFAAPQPPVPSEQRKPLTEGFTADVECITDESGTEYSVAVRGPGIRNPLYSDVWLKKKPATLLAKWLNGEVFPAIGIRSTGGEHE